MTTAPADQPSMVDLLAEQTDNAGEHGQPEVPQSADWRPAGDEIAAG